MLPGKPEGSPDLVTALFSGSDAIQDWMSYPPITVQSPSTSYVKSPSTTYVKPSTSNPPAVDQNAVNEAARKQRSLSISARGSSGSLLTPGLSTMGSAPVAQKNLLGV